MESYAIKNLMFTYPDKKKPILEDITLSINKGEFVTICGKSGCGKSTFLRLLKTVIAPHGNKSGNIYFEGQELYEIDTRVQSQKIGFVMQEPDNQIVTDKVWHELAFGLENLSYPTAEIRTRVAEMASFFGIQTWFHKDVNELSGGQKQLLNLASIIVMQPSVIILDEPTSQLDPIAAQGFLETLSKINRELGTTIILAEHRLEEIFPLSDRIIVMEDGKIIADSTPQEVGNFLKNIDNDMYLALPTPIRVSLQVENDKMYPLTVRDGRKWLEEFKKDKGIVNDVLIPETEISNTDAIIELSDIWYRYEKNEPDVLKGLSTKIFKGEFYAIVGGNGTGKSTALSIINGIFKPYRGIINIKDNITMATLPQKPQTLFLKKTVELELYDAIDDKKISESDKEKMIENVVRICRIGNLMQQHPYDLSGGEQQRTALAKILLLNSNVLLLDEPTKGLDAHFKQEFAEILSTLKQQGKTIIMVSHDIEFCAEYADRCAMFFDGNIVSEDTPRHFFSGKSFYTTSANRMARNILSDAIIADDIISACGGKIEDKSKSRRIYMDESLFKNDEVISKSKKTKRLTTKNIVFGTLFAILFILDMVLFRNKYTDYRDLIVQFSSLLLLALSVINFIPQKVLGREIEVVQVPKEKRKLSKRTIFAVLMILFAIPLTIFTSYYYLDDKKYYFISLLVIIETMLPFALIFESRKPQAKELIIISVLCAIAVAGRTIFYALPQFKPLLTLVIISGVCFGAESGFLVGALSAFVSNFLFGQGPWTPWQMFAAGIIGFIAGILFRKGFIKKTKASLCIFGGIVTILVYGLIMNTASVILWQDHLNVNMFLSSIIIGIPYDLIHAFSTIVFLYFISESMIEKIDRIKIKYGMTNK